MYYGDMTTDKIVPSNRVRSWHRSYRMQPGCSAVSLREFARMLVSHTHPPALAALHKDYKRITSDWMASKGMQA